MSKKIFAEGMYFNNKRENAPDFVLGAVSMKPEQFIEWLQKQKTNRAGYVNIDVMLGRNGKPYCQLNTYGVGISDDTGVPTQDVTEPEVASAVEYPNEEINPEDIPF